MSLICHLKHGEERQEEENESEDEEHTVVVIHFLYDKPTQCWPKNSSGLRKEIVQPGVGTDAFFIAVIVNEGQAIDVHPRPEESHQNQNDDKGDDSFG